MWTAWPALPPPDHSFYERLAVILKNSGYLPTPGRYDSLKK
jgi:hypothetical protein